jgi:HNH endonuclease
MYWDILKKFKNQLHLARKAAESMTQTNIGFKINYEKDKGGNCSMDLPPDKEVARFVTVLRPLADPASPLYFKKVAAIIIENNLVEISNEEQAELSGHMQRVEDGPMRIKVNDSVYMSAMDLYSLYGRGEYFAENPTEAGKILEYKNVPLMPQMLLFNLYSYSFDVYRFCQYLYGLVRLAEAKKNTADISAEVAQGKNQCIYCLRTDGNFSSAEHVYPESLGNTEIILPRGYVCDKCNNEVLSALDDYLVNHDGISFLRVLHVPYNPKTGKFLKARYQNMTVERTHPRNVDIRIDEKPKSEFDVKITDQVCKMKFTSIGRTKFNPQLLGRSLYKIGLGIICWSNGVQVALDKQYDTARDFILGKRAFPNNIIIGGECQISDYIRGTHYILNPGTIFEISIFGMGFLFNLESEPTIALTPELEKMHAQLFSLQN